jgi:signal transduction histidine kinase
MPSEPDAMRLAQFISTSSKRIISEWEHFARVHVAVGSQLDLEQRRDQVESMLRDIAHDLEAPRASSQRTARTVVGLSPIDVASECGALRASVLRLWSEAHRRFSRKDLEEMTRFSEAIDQLLVGSLTRLSHDTQESNDHLLGVLGHDLRNPLGAIMMSATLMMTCEEVGASGAIAARILKAGKRMDSLIGDLVDLSRTGRR